MADAPFVWIVVPHGIEQGSRWKTFGNSRKICEK